MAVSCHYVISLLHFHQRALGVANHPFHVCLVYMQGVVVVKWSLIMSFRHFVVLRCTRQPAMVC